MKAWCRAAMVVAMGCVAAAPLRASDQGALVWLRKGRELAAAKDVPGAFAAFERVNEATSFYYILEACARKSQLYDASTRDGASWRNYALECFTRKPPRWLSDEARDVVHRAVNANRATGRYPELFSPAITRPLPLSADDIGSGYKGERYLWQAPLSRIEGADEEPLPFDSDPQDNLPAGRTKLGQTWTLLDPRHAADTVPAEEKAKWACDRALAGYTLEPIYKRPDALNQPASYPIDPWYTDQSGVWRLRFRLFYPSPKLTGGVDLTATAEQVMDLLLRAQWLLAEYFDRPLLSRDDPNLVTDVWLCPQAGTPEDVDGETVDQNIWYYRCGMQRSPEEWLRLVLHELGHRFLPKLGRYPASHQYEPWLEGYLSERLLRRDLADNLRNPTAPLPAWLTPLGDAAAVATLRRDHWAPLTALWLKNGAVGGKLPAAYLRDSGDAGAQWLLGFLLWMADVHEPAFLRSLYGGVGPGSTLTAEQAVFAYTTELKKQPWFLLRAEHGWRSGGAGEPQAGPDGLTLTDDDKVVFPVYLPAGSYGFRLLGQKGGVVSVAFDGKDRQLRELGESSALAPALVLTQHQAGWLELELGGFGDKPALLKYLLFEKRRGE